MTAGTVYVLDSGVFIQAARHYYAFDVVPAFWSALVQSATNGNLVSIDRVKHELDRGKDDLTRWANGTFHPWFHATNQPDVLDAYARVMRWVQAQTQFTDGAKAEFAKAEVADAWVIAYAKAKGRAVVTQEQFNPNRRNKVLIPNVCRGLDVPCVNTFDMLRSLGVRF